MIKRLSEKGMNRLGEIQTKYKFMDTFELEDDDVYKFCCNIKQEDFCHISLCQ